MISARVRPKDLLRKLPYFGDPQGKQVNFEHPTEAIFAQMPPGLTLTSIQFSTWAQTNSAIAGVKLVYSNQTESPLFKDDEVELYHTRSIKFDSTRKVARV